MSISDQLTVAKIHEADDPVIYNGNGAPLSETIMSAVAKLAMEPNRKKETGYVFAFSIQDYYNFRHELGKGVLFDGHKFQGYNACPLNGHKVMTKSYVIGDEQVERGKVYVFNLPQEEFVGIVTP